MPPSTTQRTASTVVESEPDGTPKRLVVELNPLVSRKLTERVEAESLNKTTVVNRAIQLYALVQEAGGTIYVRDPETGELERVRIL